MPTNWEIIKWLLRKAGNAAADQVVYIVTHPLDASVDLWEWVKVNKITCLLIVAGIIVIAVPPAIGFSAAGPVAGTIAAGWQAAIGNVVAGSLFATLQSLTMTGVLTAIGGGIIGGGILRFLSTRNWKLIYAGLIQSYLRDHGQVLRTSFSTIRDLNRTLRRIGYLTRMLPPDELTRIRSLTADLNRNITRIADTRRIHELVQKLDAAIARQAPSDEISQLVARLQVASDAFCEQDAAAPSLAEEWDGSIVNAYVLCGELRQALDAALAAGTYDSELSIRGLMKELEDTSDKLLQLTFPESTS